MKKMESKSKKTAAALRREAEDRLEKRGRALLDIPEGEVSEAILRELVHELYVHQEELKMQNEELREAQEVIECSRERYADLFDFAPLGYAILDGEGKIVEANLTLASLLGTERGRLPGKPFHLYIVAAERDTFYRFQREVMKSAGHESCELKLLPQKAAPLYVHLEGVRLSSPPSAATYRMSVTDISKLKAMEEELIRHGDHLEEQVEARTAELKEANAALERSTEAAHAASRAKSEFLANMSHEIRTPLQAIVLRTELLSDPGLSAEQKEDIAVLNQACGSLIAIVNDILDLSKMEAGKMTLGEAPFNLEAFMGEVIQFSDSAARKKGLKLTCRIDEDVPAVVVGDSAHLRQILVNLVNNAVKFTPKGGVEVIVRGGGTGMVEFVVRDTGIGIAPEKLRDIFENFFQADSSSTRIYGGTGLGTTIAKKTGGIDGGKDMGGKRARAREHLLLRPPS